MRTQWICLSMVVVTAGCEISSVSRSGPTPKVLSVARGDQGFPAEAVLCTDIGGTLVISGEGFAPMPRDVLEDNPGVALPSVVFRAADGTVVFAFDTTYDPAAKTLTVVPNAPIPPGIYDIVVTNPNGNSGTLPEGLQVVPPPVVTGVVPSSGPNNVLTPVDVQGTDFRRAADGTEPTVTMTPNAGGTTTPLSAVAWQSAASVFASVPTGLQVTTYDLTLMNPEGCSFTLPNAYTVIQPPTIDLCGSVDPAFGWVDGRTTIEICADNANGFGLAPVPEVFLLVDPDGDGQNVTEVPLIREAFINAHADLSSRGGPADASLMSAVVPAANEPRGAGIVVGTVPYKIRVVNPDGAEAMTATGVFKVLASPPPHIDGISPEQQQANQGTKTLTLTGSDFKDPTGATLARVMLITAEQASGATCPSATCFVCGSALPSGAAAANGTYDAVTCQLNTALAAGSYVVRYEHVGDGSYSDFAALAITNPAGKLSGAAAAMAGTLGTGRFALGAALGRDDLGNRYLYAVGGQSGAGADTALDTAEVGSLSRFGDVTAFTTLPTLLPVKLSGLAVLAYGNYLFAFGGKDVTGAPVTPVYRARVLGSDSAPYINPPALVAGGSLAVGTYSFKISAVMATLTDNPDGESLASDAETIRTTAAERSVHLSWNAVIGAKSYRLYRTAAENQLAGTEVFIKDVGNVTSYTDAGDDPDAAGGTVLPAGATGRWSKVGDLAIPRGDAGATIATWTDTSGTPVVHTYAYVVAGRSTGGTAVASYDYAELIEDSTAGLLHDPSVVVYTLGTFGTGVEVLANPRAEAVVTTLNKASAPDVIASATDNYVVAAIGTDGSFVYGGIYRAKAGANGALEAWTLTENAGSAQTLRYGASGCIANSFFYALGGRNDPSTYFDRNVWGPVSTTTGGACLTGPCITWGNGDSGLTFATGGERYRSGFVYAAGLFYFIAGQSSTTTALQSVVRGGF
ncbi:MAG: hypothetical protein HY903_13490 [Deltaproteobacteria bacterium]|nr:hypothetical protein [Deltaproteobacteria bacterium]